MTSKPRTKLLLTVAVAMLGVGIILNTGLIHPGKAAALYVLLPVGAIFLGLYLISRLLENESPIFEEDQRHAAAGHRARGLQPAPDPGKPTAPGT